MKLRFWLSISMLGPSLLFLAKPSVAQSFNFVSIDVPCSACPGAIARQTIAFGINPGGDIVGSYLDAVGAQHGFLLSGGRFTTIDFPGATATAARGVGPSGDIVGQFTAPVSSAPDGSPEYCPAATSTACIKGFLLSHGRFSMVLVPGHRGSIAHSITPTGDIYGCVHDFDMMASMYGFARTRSGDTTLLAGGGELADPSASVPASMNNGATPDGSTIVGLYIDMTNHRHGYVIQNGIFQPYDVPGGSRTSVWGINPGADFVGSYSDSSGFHGFLQPAAGSSPISIDYPTGHNTAAYAINPGGAIVGQYTDNAGQIHGFLAVPTTGN